MARIFVSGSQVQIATGYQTGFTISDITNASPAVATLSASHGVTVGDFVEITSCLWDSLSGRVFRASAVNVNDVTLEGLDTSDTDVYPSGTITGAGKEITGWANVAQVTELNVSGGEQQYGEGQYIDNPLQYRFPTFKTAVTMTVGVDDDQTASFWTHVKSSEGALENRAMRILDKGGVPRVVATGIWAKSAAPAIAINSVYKRQISIALASGTTEYTT